MDVFDDAVGTWWLNDGMVMCGTQFIEHYRLITRNVKLLSVSPISPHIVVWYAELSEKKYLCFSLGGKTIDVAEYLENKNYVQICCNPFSDDCVVFLADDGIIDILSIDISDNVTFNRFDLYQGKNITYVKSLIDTTETIVNEFLLIVDEKIQQISFYDPKEISVCEKPDIFPQLLSDEDKYLLSNAVKLRYDVHNLWIAILDRGGNLTLIYDLNKENSKRTIIDNVDDFSNILSYKLMIVRNKLATEVFLFDNSHTEGKTVPVEKYYMEGDYHIFKNTYIKNARN